MTERATICVSVVSHGHGEEVLSLLEDLCRLCTRSVSQVVLTLNVPEPEVDSWVATRRFPFELNVVRNTGPKGYGANHNAAFAHCRSTFFCVLNPDVVLDNDPFPMLVLAAQSADAGLAFPIQLDKHKRPQDFARRVPTPWDLVGRHLLRKKFVPPSRPEFVSGACMFFPSDVYRTIAGFDERYFMYCEDVDISLRTQLAGKRLVPAKATIIHEAHRSSRKNLRHMSWHIRSLIRLWSSTAFWKFWKNRRETDQ